MLPPIVHDKNLFLVAQTFLSVRFDKAFKDYTDKNVRATEASIQTVCEILSCTKVIAMLSTVQVSTTPPLAFPLPKNQSVPQHKTACRQRPSSQNHSL